MPICFRPDCVRLMHSKLSCVGVGLDRLMPD